MRLLLLSNSSVYGRRPFEHVSRRIKTFCADSRILFIPFALADHDGYTSTVSKALHPLQVDGGHRAAHLVDDLGDPDRVVLVGGGNTFRLLKVLQDKGLVPALQNRIKSGKRYAGSSAGSVICGPTIRTTNDMPIVEPDGLAALNAFGFHLNCHYVDKDPRDRHMGESRELRLQQFHEENATPVLAMREGAWLEVDGESARLDGPTGGRLFRAGVATTELDAGADLTQLLTDHPASVESGRTS